MLGVYGLFGLGGVWLFICIYNGIDFLVHEKRADELRCMAQEKIIGRGGDVE